MKVSYAVKRPEITAFDPRVDMETYADRLVADLLLTKGKDWEYEQEWRMVLPLDDQQQYPHEISGRAHLFYIPRDALRAVVLGARVSDATTTAVCEAVESIPGLSHVTIRQARTSDTEYEITIG